MGKYIIELERGETAYKTVDSDGGPLIQLLDPKPYTEPDLDAIREEEYEKGVQDTKQHWVDAPRSCAYKFAYEKGYENGFIAGHLKAEKSGQSFYEDGYKRGLADAWEAARTLWNTAKRKEIFGYTVFSTALMTLTGQEAIEKIRQYEQEKEEIKVGDEVVGTYTGGEETEPFVIIRKIPEIDPPYYFGIYSKSGEFCQGGLKLKKTGRHFPEIAEVLEKMRGE